MSEHYRLLVLGGGPTAFSAVSAYREAGGQGAVALVADEARMPYRRPPLTKELLRGESEEDALPLEEERWLVDQEIGLIATRAVALDPDERTVILSGGRSLEYATCLLATGSEPKRLPIPGADDPAVRMIRTIVDLRELVARLSDGEPVVVIGSGFIGCEIAASLRLRGHPVTLISDESAPNETRLGEEPAAELRRWLQEDGVELRLGAGVEAISHDGDTLVVSAAGQPSAATVVVMATGVAPRGELAAAAGLALAGGAVPVDASMRSEHEALLAAGDVARAYNEAAGRPLRVEHWGDALGQGRIAGLTAAGQTARWSDVPGFWSTIGRRTLKYAAWGDGFDQVTMRHHDDGAFTAWYAKEGKLVGVLAHEADEDYERGEEQIKQGASWSS